MNNVQPPAPGDGLPDVGCSIVRGPDPGQDGLQGHLAVDDRSLLELAEEVTRIVHGDEALALAVRASEVFFGGDMRGLRDLDLADIFQEVPSFTVTPEALDNGIKITEALTAAGAAKSKGEAMRLIAGGGVYLNNTRLESADLVLHRDSLASATMFVLRVGKKSYFLGKVAL